MADPGVAAGLLLYVRQCCLTFATGEREARLIPGRGFAATAQPFLFGVCAPGGTVPVCSADPGTVPKAVDVITPAGVSQATELDPTLGTVVIQPVTVP